MLATVPAETGADTVAKQLSGLTWRVCRLICSGTVPRDDSSMPSMRSALRMAGRSPRVSFTTGSRNVDMVVTQH